VDLGGHVMVWIWEADSHVLINVQRVGLLSEIVRPDESTCFGGVVVFGAVSKGPPENIHGSAYRTIGRAMLL
jgi:hypothetical protein